MGHTQLQEHAHTHARKHFRTSWQASATTTVVLAAASSSSTCSQPLRQVWHAESCMATVLCCTQALVLLGWCILGQHEDPEYAALVDEGELDEAIQSFEAALASDPNDLEVRGWEPWVGSGMIL